MEKVWEGVQRTTWLEDVLGAREDFSLRMGGESDSMRERRAGGSSRRRTGAWGAA